MSEGISNIRRAIAEKTTLFGKRESSFLRETNVAPIGIFDSGVGGLTVLGEVIKQLPSENLIYLADTARVPYGGRPAEEIIEINSEILDYFAGQNVKMVIMACGTSSAIAYPVLANNYNFPIISLIQPGAYAAVSASRNNKIGLIATLGTVNSSAYKKAIKNIKSEAEVFAAACPLFVPLIEGGFAGSEEIKKVAKEYLKPILSEGIDTLILGCTHYPHLSKVLKEIAGNNVSLIDPAEASVHEAKQIIEKNNMLNREAHRGKIQYVVTGPVRQFEEVGTRLFGHIISQAKQIKL